MKIAVRAPRIPFRDLPESEQDRADHISILLQNLDSRCEDLEAAVALFKYSKPSVERIGKRSPSTVSKHRAWMHIAARDAASTIYKFSEDLDFIGHNLQKCPTLVTMIDRIARRAATRKFSQNFPGFRGVRHGSHHHAKLYGTPEGLARHKAGRIVVMEGLLDDTLQTTFEKKIVELPINNSSVAKLKEVRDLYWSAFEPVDPDFRRVIELHTHIEHNIAKWKRDINRRKPSGRTRK
jgi:hypothetical protein